jgi:hypothetical protein
MTVDARDAAAFSDRWYRRALQLPLSDELRVALCPRRAYAMLASEPEASPTRALVTRASLPLLWIALLISMMVTLRVTVGIILTAALCWCFVMLLQGLAGVGLIASAPNRRVSRRRALDLWFAAHLPYSLWLILPATWSTLRGDLPPGVLLLTVLVPLAWTLWIGSIYCQTVLCTSRGGARLRLAVHQIFVWLLVIAYILFGGGVAGLTRYLARQFGMAV